jgi:hypothetical protein
MVAKGVFRRVLLVLALAIALTAGTTGGAAGVGCAECAYYEELAMCVMNGNWQVCNVYRRCDPQGNCFEYCRLQSSCFWV